MHYAILSTMYFTSLKTKTYRCIPKTLTTYTFVEFSTLLSQNHHKQQKNARYLKYHRLNSTAKILIPAACGFSGLDISLSLLTHFHIFPPLQIRQTNIF
jgi:hypothetical protein